MSDANSKPVAGASEPHELEERAIQAACTAADVHLKCSYPMCTCKSAPAGARAVLDLVRQEQEKALADTIVLPGLRAWWLSHTAKETSNG